ncbi:beta-glucosidase [Winogradskya humida]|uniref:Beta-glucosidase n=1 Tax=Winogradskya humida TaxID=113566 RepID=A0ABQ3ZLE1_9ACTN|nr:glycoside hydrolase family 3 C-terminal domain-containing protein [Actinoplanes humidus]GIE19411.1 beta-glucosidase [Actinoplanes humidus]
MRLVRMALAGVLVCGALVGLGGSSSSPSMDQRVEALLAKMTRAEKLTLMHGGKACGYVGCVDGIPRLGIPPLHLQDGPAGVGGSLTGVTQLPAPVAAAASWDPALMTAYGKVLGAEEWAKGANVVLAPTINIVRDPRWGRAFESLGEDPYLAGQSAAAEIAGIRSQGPIAQVKHYAVYNQETRRNTPGSDARIDERTMREIYLPAFEDAINAGVGSVMCGYNPVNGTFPCENSELQEKILHDEFGFDGFITSDWDATHSTEASASNGLDMEMPGDKYFGKPLTDSTINVDESARRILTSMFRQGLFDNPPTGTLDTRVTSTANAAIARQVAEQGSVLLKNAGNLLPLDAAQTGSIAVIGNGGETSVLSQGGGSARVDPEYVVSPYQGIKERDPSTTYQPGTVRADGAFPPVFSTFRTNFFTGTGLSAVFSSRTDKVLDGSWRGGDPGTGRKSQWSARSTTTITPSVSGVYRFSLSNTDGARLRVGDKTVIDTGWAEHKARTTTGSITLTAGKPVPVTVEYAQFTGNAVLTLGWLQPGQDLHNDAVRVAATADLAVVVVGRFGTEGADLPDINLPEAQNRLVQDVAAANPNTIVVVNSGSAVTMPWSASVRAIIETWFPGQEYGHALANLLYGTVNFSAKLPVTFPVSLADAPAADPARFPGGNYSEGLSVGYRWYDTQAVQPLFEFGFGLSYTTFAYSDLRLSPAKNGSIQVQYTITNTGKRPGAEVAQVYVQQPPAAGEPPRNLRGFAKVQLSPGQSQRITTTLAARSFQHWQNGTWHTIPGTYTISVGASSRDLRLIGSLIE